MRQKWFKRTTFLITLWSAGLLTYIVVFNLSNPFLISLAPILGAVILASVGGEKMVDVRHGPEQESKE